MKPITTNVEEIGRSMARGALSEIWRWAWPCLFIWLAIAIVVSWGRDDTDDRASGRRSGLRPRIDYGTGCQYLESAWGSLTPRLDRTGRQVCR